MGSANYISLQCDVTVVSIEENGREDDALVMLAILYRLCQQYS